VCNSASKVLLSTSSAEDTHSPAPAVCLSAGLQLGSHPGLTGPPGSFLPGPGAAAAAAAAAGSMHPTWGFGSGDSQGLMSAPPHANLGVPPHGHSDSMNRGMPGSQQYQMQAGAGTAAAAGCMAAPRGSWSKEQARAARQFRRQKRMEKRTQGKGSGQGPQQREQEQVVPRRR
jgi:hypothetical protein